MTDSEKFNELKYQIFNRSIAPLNFRIGCDYREFADSPLEDSSFYTTKLSELQEYICHLNELKTGGSEELIADIEDSIEIVKYTAGAIEKFLQGNADERRESKNMLRQIVNIIGCKWLKMFN
ncbi:MAG: hypothetical protein LBR64_04305 [Dysgonamonadaceae bacterium]|jgi:hypothetical protein|nr:hypothetical protein [Dysgonamonadaceae bacterium]